MASRAEAGGGIAAVIFDLDGVLLDSESAWVRVKREYTEETGRSLGGARPVGHARHELDRVVATYMHDELGVPGPPERISAEVAESARRALPGAVAAATRRRWTPSGARRPSGRSALASSSNRNVIDLVLDLAGIADAFAATVSSEEVERGKPAPDVYLEAARRLEVDPEVCAAIEDSTNGIRSAHAAAMAVIADPQPGLPARARGACPRGRRSSTR